MSSILLNPNAPGLFLPKGLTKERRRVWSPRRDALWTPGKDLLFRIGRYKDREIRTPFHVNMRIGNYLRLEIMGADGRKRWATDWFRNHITNSGLDMCATTGTRYAACQVGTGNLAVADTNTTLQTFLAGTSTRTIISHTGNNSSPYQTEFYVRFDFATGAVVGNIAELGVGPSATTGTNLFCRELVRDAGGSATTIAITSIDTLRVHYKVRHYPPLVDGTGLINGTTGGVADTRNYTRRALGAGLLNGFNAQWGPVGVSNQHSASSGHLLGTVGTTYFATDGLAAINNSNYTGSGAAAATSLSVNSYSAGTYTRSGTMTWGPSVANQANKRVIWAAARDGVSSESGMYFQCEFDVALTKTNVQSITLTMSASWSRYLL